MSGVSSALYLLSLGVVGLGFVLTAVLRNKAADRIGMLYYCAFLLLSTTTDLVFVVIFGERSPVYYGYWWQAELIRQSCQLAFVIRLVAYALPPGRQSVVLVRVVVAFAVALWAGSLVFYHDPEPFRWLGPVARNLSFASAIINLVLWFSLIASTRRDMKLLMVSGGLGIQMTGDAISQSLLQLNARVMGHVVSSVSYFICLFIWWQAFRPTSAKPSNPTAEERPAPLGTF